MTQKWIEVNNLSSSQYSVSKDLRFKTSMLRSHLCNYGDAYIVVKGAIVLLAADANENDKAEKMLRLKIMLHLDHAYQKLTVH